MKRPFRRREAGIRRERAPDARRPGTAGAARSGGKFRADVGAPAYYGCDIFLFDVAKMLNGPGPAAASASASDGTRRAPSKDHLAPAGDDGRPSADSNRGQRPIYVSLRSKLTKEHRECCDPFSCYRIVEILGAGSMGCVAKVKKIGGGGERGVGDRPVDRDAPTPAGPSSARTLARGSSHYEMYFALKSIRLDRVAEDSFAEQIKNEIDILRTLDHPHIVRAIETFYQPDQIFMVLELCNGGDLYTRDPYTENEAATIVSSILSAISYMHSHNICHRDLKFENILFASNSPRSEIKLIDFGLSKKYAAENDIMTESVGTIYTMAPEVMRGRYTSQADLWSIGVITFMLLSSTMPFYGKTRKDIIERIQNCQYNFEALRWKYVSDEAKAFVSSLLVVDYEKCPTAARASKNAWFDRQRAASIFNPDMKELDAVQKSMASFAEYSKLKKVALMVISHQSTTNEIGILRKIFQQFDIDKDGAVSLPEFKQTLALYNYGESELENLFRGIDLDGTGKVRYTEFVAASIEALGPINEERIAEAFCRLDCDDSGFISAEDLHELLDDVMSAAEINQMCGGSGISYRDFLSLWDICSGSETKGTTSDAPSVSSTDSIYHISGKKVAPIEAAMTRANFIAMKKMSERKFSASYSHPIIDIGSADKLTERLFQDVQLCEDWTPQRNGDKHDSPRR